jgi:hypothetical protein
MNSSPTPPQSNTLGKASLALSVISITFVFGIGLCAGVGKQQGWLPLVSTILFIVGGTSAFIGVLAALLGFLGLFGRNRPRGIALVGMLLGAGAAFLFAAIVQNAQK